MSLYPRSCALLNILCASLLLAAACVQAATVKVFLLGGQSNMAGRADDAGLPAGLQSPQADVLFYYDSSLTTLRPGSGTDFGPEVSFGRSVADTFPSEMFCLIKYAVGGTDLYSDWDPTGGSVYTAFRNKVTAGLAALTSAGHTYVIVGMLWTQGESDAGAFRTTAQYQADLNEFIADIRTRYGSELPFFLSRLSDAQTAITPSRLAQIQTAQEDVAAADSLTHIINIDDIGMKADNLHFNAAGQVTLGERFATAYAQQHPSDPAEQLAYYPFDSDFSDASTNNNHLSVAALTPTITTTVGEYRYGGGALDLDSTTGNEEYLDLTSAITFTNGTPWSISFWARRRTGTGDSTGMIAGDPGNNADFIWVTDNASQVRGVRFRNTGGNSYDYGTFPDDNAFHHWVIIADGAGNVSAYRDNVSLGTRAANTAFKITSVGQAYGNTLQSMDGQIDELRIYSKALDATTVSNLYFHNSANPPLPPPIATDDTETVVIGTATNLYVMANDGNADGIAGVDATATNAAGTRMGQVSFTPGSTYATFTANQGLTGDAFFSYVVTNAYGSATGRVTVTVIQVPEPNVYAHYPFDSNYRDSSGNGHHGTLADVGTPGDSGITTAVGEFKFGGGALTLTSDRDYVAIPSKTFSSGVPYSISFWARKAAGDTGDPAVWDMVIGQRDGTTFFVALNDAAGTDSRLGLRWRSANSSAGRQADFATPDDTTWHHHVITADNAQNISYYLDGAFVDTDTGNATGIILDTIGEAYSTACDFDFHGQIDEVWVFDETLTATAVANLYSHNSTAAPGAEGTLLIIR